MSYVVRIIPNGVYVIDGMGVVSANNANAVFQATKGSANNATPIIEGALDTNTFAEFLKSASDRDMNAFTRDVTASALGLLAGLASLPFGPAASLLADQAFSEAFKKAYDAASTWSQNQDWSKFYDFWDRAGGSEFSTDGDPFTGMPWPNAISPLLGSLPDPLVPTLIRVMVDPLILDLDGDGLEISPLAAGVLFDANGDTVKTGTAWAGADDGMLVWDRNGNGLIDNGGELFGDETVLANGTKAANGFVALAEQDSNGDGTFDEKDHGVRSEKDHGVRSCLLPHPI